MLPTLGPRPEVWALERENAKCWPRASRVGDFGAHGGVRNAKSGCRGGSGWGVGCRRLIRGGAGERVRRIVSVLRAEGGERRARLCLWPAQSPLTPRAPVLSRNFTLFHHPMYGNCYTFNSKENEVVHSTSMGGSEYGKHAGTPAPQNVQRGTPPLRSSPPEARGLPTALAGTGGAAHPAAGLPSASPFLLTSLFISATAPGPLLVSWGTWRDPAGRAAPRRTQTQTLPARLVRQAHLGLGECSRDRSPKSALPCPMWAGSSPYARLSVGTGTGALSSGG